MCEIVSAEPSLRVLQCVDPSAGFRFSVQSRPRRLLAGALAGGARGRGARDPSLECGRVAGTSPSKDRSARHRVAEARVPGVAAWRTGPCSMARVPTLAEEDAKRPNR